jgi:hypothetical protein
MIEETKNPYADIPDIEPERTSETMPEEEMPQMPELTPEEEEETNEEERAQINDPICKRCPNYEHCIINFSEFCDERIKMQKRLNRIVEKAQGRRGWKGFWARQNEKDREDEIKKAIEIIQHEATLLAALNASLHRVLEEIPRAISDKAKMAMLERHKGSLIDMIEEAEKG